MAATESRGDAGRTSQPGQAVGGEAVGRRSGTTLAAACIVLGCAAIASPTVGAAVAGPPAANESRILGPANPRRSLPIVLGLERRQGALARFVAEVSDPGSARYGHYLPVEDVSRRFGASPKTRRAVLAYLRRRGIDARIDPTGTFAEARMRVDEASRLFSPRLPARLRGRVTELLGLDTAPAIGPVAPPRTPSSAAAAASGSEDGEGSGTLPIPPRPGTPHGCEEGVDSGGFTPNQLVRAYHVDALHRRGVRGQDARVALVEWGGGSRSDLRTFVRCFDLGMPRRFREIPLDGKEPLDPNGEAVSDAEVIAAIAPRLRRLEMFEIDAGDTIAQSSATLPRLFAAPLDRGRHSPLPDVISSSLGNCEQQVVEGPRRVLLATEHVLMSAAAAGVTVVSGAGDWGSTGCVDDSAEIEQPPQKAVFYPASSRFVTAVGGTFLDLSRHNRIQHERVWNDTLYSSTALLGGGGGVSRVLGRPGWQRGPGVDRTRPRHGRAVPDVSYFADGVPGYALYCSVPNCEEAGLPAWNTLGGTSFATPLLGAGLALVNQDLRRHGQGPIGFANPLIYRLARDAGGSRGPVFRDVRRTDNDVSGVGCCDARRNFDAASGWGSLDLFRFARAAGGS